MENGNNEHLVKADIYSCYYLIAAFAGIILTATPVHASAQEPDPHDIYDLRMGVERYYTPCIPILDFISCGLSHYVYQQERVLDNIEMDGNVYTRIERISISNIQFIVSRDTLYQRLDGNILVQRQGTEDQMLYRFDFELGDSVKYYYNDTEPDNSIYHFTNSSIITADTTVIFPDGEPYQVVFGSDGTYPWDNARLVEELSGDWSNTEIHQGTLGSNVVGLNWLVPYANMNGVWDTPQFHISVQTFYHVSRFGPILSKAHTGLRVLAGFKGHDGRMYGYFHNGIPGAPLSIGGSGNEGAAEFRLLGNYPNPFNPSTVIRYQLSETSEVRLEVVNMMGQQVALPVNHEVQQAGIHDAAFNASGLSSGVYFYRLVVRQAGLSNIKTGNSTGKMLLIK